MKESPINKYVILKKQGKSNLVIASGLWVIEEKRCLYPRKNIDLHLQNNDLPEDNWSMFKCSIVHKCESLKSANELLAALQVCYATDENYPPDENTLPLNTDKQKRSALKRKESFLYNSVDMDVAEMHAGNTRVQYPKLRMFKNVVSPIANSTQLDSSPSTSEDKNLTARFERIYTLLLKVSASISELNTNMKLVLS
uniref:Uncharacterized protein n=1 Tax=Schistosoma mansoni TaxID=6183 RepID=A0A5K4F4M3_SCHMA